MNRLSSLLLFGLAPLILACRSTDQSEALAQVEGLRVTLEELYLAFNFDPGVEPDWATQRRIYLEGATFVPPISPGRAPVGEDTETFLEGFRQYATSPPFSATGFHERIIGTRISVFGGVAHAFVLFEGFWPGDGVTRTRGMDSLQFVHDGEGWRLSAFATQYEGPGVSLPAEL